MVVGMKRMVPTGQPALSAEFEALCHAHFDFVWRTLRRFGVSEAALDDATQDVFVVMHRRFGAWEQRASVRAWLAAVGMSRGRATVVGREKRRRRRAGNRGTPIRREAVGAAR